MEDAQLLEKIVHRLNVLIALELDKADGPENVRTSEKIFRLSEMGLRPADISEILGKTSNYITGTLSRRKTIISKEK